MEDIFKKRGFVRESVAANPFVAGEVGSCSCCCPACYCLGKHVVDW